MIDNKTKILGLFGYPLEHSFSPLLHNQAIKELGLNYAYFSFPVKPDLLKDAVSGLRALNFRGVNVTIPYKEKIIPYLDELDSLAEKVGAVNTIVNNDGILKGYNTDVIGLKRMIEEDAGYTLQGYRAVVIGAGGAARAACFTVLQGGAKELTILNRTGEKAVLLAESVEKYYPSVDIKGLSFQLDKECRKIVENANIVIDTTPVGMSPAIEVEPIIPEKWLNPGQLIVDLVYNPPITTLLKAAQKAGTAAINGKGMLLYQGIEAFKIWTGLEPNVESWKKLI